MLKAAIQASPPPLSGRICARGSEPHPRSMPTTLRSRYSPWQRQDQDRKVVDLCPRRSPGKSPPAVWFTYSQNRKGEHPRQHLKQFQGALQAHACDAALGVVAPHHSFQMNVLFGDWTMHVAPAPIAHRCRARAKRFFAVLWRTTSLPCLDGTHTWVKP
jgi:hypothetical protein